MVPIVDLYCMLGAAKGPYFGLEWGLPPERGTKHERARGSDQHVVESETSTE